MKNCNCPELSDFWNVLITLIMESILKNDNEFLDI